MERDIGGATNSEAGKLDGGSFKVLSMKEWVAGAMERGLDEVLGSFLLASKGVIRVPLLQKRHGMKR